MNSTEGLIGYVRVSTDEQSSNGAGLEAQRLAIEGECSRRRWNLVRFEEDVLSGKHLRRPGLQCAVADCRSGEVAGIIVAKLDRLSRSLLDFAGLLAQAQREGWNLVALDVGVDLSTPQGEFLASVMASIAQWERRIIGQRTKEALAVKRAQGVALGRPQSIAPDIAERIKDLRRRGASLQSICDELNSNAVPTPRGGVTWRPSSLRAVVRSVNRARGVPQYAAARHVKPQPTPKTRERNVEHIYERKSYE